MSLIPKTILPHIPSTYPASLSPTQVEFEISNVLLDALLINHYTHDYMGIIITLSQVESCA